MGFADDVIGYTRDKDLNEALKKAQIQANEIVKYFRANKFSIQTDKTAVLEIAPN